MNGETAFAAAATGCPNRYGMVENRRYYRGSRLFFSNTLHVNTHTHVTERYRELFRLHVHDFDPGRGAETEEAARPAGSSIVIHPGGKWPPRRWSVVGYLDLARELVRDGARVTVILHRSEPGLVSFFRGRKLPGGVSLHQIDTMRTLMDVVESCSYFIGNDSGPAHLANLFGIPLTVIWGPGDLERISPLGPNVQILSVDIPCRPCRQYIHPVLCENGTNDCLQNISVDDVLQAVHRHRDEKQWHSFAT
jgi:ADP-heptose:LPS heptosyltransferase